MPCDKWYIKCFIGSTARCYSLVRTLASSNCKVLRSMPRAGFEVTSSVVSRQRTARLPGSSLWLRTTTKRLTGSKPRPCVPGWLTWYLMTLFQLKKFIQSECSTPSNFPCYAFPHNLLKSLVLVFFQALGMENIALVQRVTRINRLRASYRSDCLQPL
jgi:hypothetical protein